MTVYHYNTIQYNEDNNKNSSYPPTPSFHNTQILKLYFCFHVTEEEKEWKLPLNNFSSKRRGKQDDDKGLPKRIRYVADQWPIYVMKHNPHDTY